MIRLALVRGSLALALAALAACGDPPAPTRGAAPGSNRSRADQAASADDPPASPGGARGGNTAARPGSPAGGRGDGGVAERPAPLPLTDNDFTESDRTRDPFRNFAREFIPVGPTIEVSQNRIKLRDYGLEELRLIAVIVGTDNPYAMLVDPTGRGTIIRRGEYVGRPERISTGADGTLPHEVPWRVARIVGSRVRRDRDNNLDEIPGEVVFEREDRLNPNAPRAERVITLTPGAQATRGAEGGAEGTARPPPLPGLGPGGSPFLPSLPSSTGASAGQGGAATTYVQTYNTPPTPATPPTPTTVVIQTGPQGQTTVSQPGSGAGGQRSGANSAPSAPQGPRDPYAPPPGGSNAPPPVVITGSSPLPMSGLGQ